MSSSSRCDAPDAPNRRTAVAAALIGACLPTAWAQPEAQVPVEVLADLPGARLHGRGTLRFFALHVYDALLWTPPGFTPAEVERSALALELRYARALRGPLIAERSLEEMRRVGEFEAPQAERWLGAMKQLFPDVGAGDRITGVHRPGETARFHVNGRLAGEVRDALFARLFFAIWLSPRTSEPKLRAALLGLA
jgi:hypothetical protein